MGREEASLFTLPSILQRVLTCEWINGCKITDTAGLERMKVNKADVGVQWSHLSRPTFLLTLSVVILPLCPSGGLASFLQICRKLVEAFSLQIFQTGFVHGDPHPGNS